MTGDAPPVQERLRFWLIPVLVVGVGAAAYAGVASDLIPGLSPWPTLSAFYFIAQIDMADPWPIWPFFLGYCGAFLIWSLILISTSSVRLTFTYFASVGVFVVANVAWLLVQGGANVHTLAAGFTSVLMPLGLLLSGIARRRKLGVNGVILYHGLLFAWFAYGAFPLLPGTFE